MGNGDDELGKILIKGFIYALSQMETHPDTILFYNGGAKLTTEDSESLEDLKKMEEEGVEILTCGTCLKHYGLMEKLMVGKVTDMYTIAERMTGADKVFVRKKMKAIISEKKDRYDGILNFYCNFCSLILWYLAYPVRIRVRAPSPVTLQAVPKLS